MIAYKIQLENCIHVTMICIARFNTLMKFPRKFLQNNLLPQGGAVVHYPISQSTNYPQRFTSMKKGSLHSILKKDEI